MLDGLLMLLSLSAVMAVASFLAGTLPLSFSLSRAQLQLVSTLGMGVLVGTSLIVIIPEGVETLYSASASGASHAHKRRAISHLPDHVSTVNWARFAPAPPILARDDVSSPAANPFNLPGPVIPDNIPSTERGGNDPPKTPTEPGVVGIMEVPPSTPVLEHAVPEEPSSPHAWVGVSLIAGFILMYLIDTLPHLSASAAGSQRAATIYSLSDLSASGASPGGDLGSRADSSASSAGGSFSTTLGLLIHAFADGIALGASSSMPGLSFVVFFAIMVHKAPAAFGLTTVLLRQGLSKRQARTHLAAFSLAAPAGAVLTWFVVGLLGGLRGGQAGEEGMRWWTGIILLFSGGTFLYVAMHTMQENDAADAAEESNGSANGYLGVDGHAGHHKSKKSLKLVGAAVAGMLLPAITQIGHAH